MTTAPLDPTLTGAALTYLGVAADAPTLGLLDRLVTAYTRTVPWESAARIAKRARTPAVTDCPRWPAEFWADAMERGMGGTCFESNYAFSSLLRTLGYDVYLTINDMHETVGCHTAIVVRLDGAQWIADVGMPLYLPVPFTPDAARSRRTPFHTYTVRPTAPGCYTVERDAHPNPYCFTFLDRPIPDAAYRAATTADYEPTGNFNDRVIVTKVVGDEIWRFNGAMPRIFESFVYGGRSEHPLIGDPATAIAERFTMDGDIVRTALAATKG